MRINEENFVDKAEKAIKKTNDKNGKRALTTSQIRNILAMAADIYNDVLNETGNVLSREIIGRIEYLKVRLIYDGGREAAVKNFVDNAELLEIISEIGNNKQNFVMFHRYMEALVAYHKFYGGSEQ